MSKNSTYPALRMSMGSWDYYSVRMSLKEVSKKLVMASNFKEATVLDDMLQRIWDDTRSQGAMTNYLKVRDDRFYGSLIVAPIGKSPKWHQLPAPEDFIKQHQVDNDSLGFIELDKDTDYYVLDGQHRLGSIKHVINEDLIGPEFGDEEINVLVVCNPDDDEIERNIKYRRLFTSLNKYAKPTDATTNIIMEEDDAFAILTRMLVEDHPAFDSKAGDKAMQNSRVNIKTKNLTKGTAHFTSLVALNGMIKTLIQTPEFPDLNPATPVALLTRPSNDELDIMYAELSLIWDVIGEIFPEIYEDLTKLRSNNSKNDEEYPCAFMYPVIQEGLWAPMIRKYLNDAEFGNKDSYLKALKPLRDIDWDLRNIPWNPLVLGKSDPTNPDSSLIILDEDRKNRVKQMRNAIYYITGKVEFSEADLLDLRANIQAFTTQLENPEAQEIWWKEFLSLKA